ncbi:hypothetical protein CspHIS471_0306730 [Cutaneotrichosporon sp. HIS471]|nr:hypothetical protein CspHIS471_0306730 [Cutaneotrichosporon sp. HIS471]
MPSISIDPPRSAERRRRGRGVDVMSAMPTPEKPRLHLPTPVTQRRRTDTLAPSDHTGIHLPTPQTLPRKRGSPSTEDPASPTGHTQFFFAQSAAEPSEPAERVPPRRRPGLMFAQQMGLTQADGTSDIKFGARLGVGVGMGGVMRSSHGPVVDKVTVDHQENPFLVQPSSSRTANPFLSWSSSQSRPVPPTPGTETSYVPQALRPSEERSLSPHPRRRPRVPVGLDRTSEALAAAARRQAMMDEDNPFIAKPGEVVRANPTREDSPHVTYVFRGSKKVFANPFFPPETEYAPSQLDPTHPDFDPHPCPKPRLLFPTPAIPVAPSTQAEPETPPRTHRTLTGFQSMDVDQGPIGDDDDLQADLVDDSDEEEEEMPARRGMLFGPRGMKRDRGSSGFEARKRARG